MIWLSTRDLRLKPPSWMLSTYFVGAFQCISNMTSQFSSCPVSTLSCDFLCASCLMIVLPVCSKSFDLFSYINPYVFVIIFVMYVFFIHVIKKAFVFLLSIPSFGCFSFLDSLLLSNTVVFPCMAFLFWLLLMDYRLQETSVLLSMLQNFCMFCSFWMLQNFCMF